MVTPAPRSADTPPPPSDGPHPDHLRYRKPRPPVLHPREYHAWMKHLAQQSGKPLRVVYEGNGHDRPVWDDSTDSSTFDREWKGWDHGYVSRPGTMSRPGMRYRPDTPTHTALNLRRL